jgi:hypothetical protein
MPAIDLFRIVGETDRLDDRALLQRLAGALYLQILDQHDTVSVGKNIAGGGANLGCLGRLCGNLGRWPPFACCFVLGVVVVLVAQ